MYKRQDEGNLVDDLYGTVRQHVELVLRPEFLRGLPALQEAFRVEVDLWDSTMERHVTPPVDGLAQVLEAAFARGEIVGHLEPSVVLNSMTGALHYMARLGLMTPDELVEHGVRLITGSMVEWSKCAADGSG